MVDLLKTIILIQTVVHAVQGGFLTRDGQWNASFPTHLKTRLCNWKRSALEFDMVGQFENKPACRGDMLESASRLFRGFNPFLVAKDAQNQDFNQILDLSCWAERGERSTVIDSKLLPPGISAKKELVQESYLCVWSLDIAAKNLLMFPGGQMIRKCGNTLLAKGAIDPDNVVDTRIPHIVVSLSAEKYCLSRDGEHRISDWFRATVKGLPEEWDPVRYISFVEMMGTVVPSRICVGSLLQVVTPHQYAQLIVAQGFLIHPDDNLARTRFMASRIVEQVLTGRIPGKIFIVGNETAIRGLRPFSIQSFEDLVLKGVPNHVTRIPAFESLTNFVMEVDKKRSAHVQTAVKLSVIRNSLQLAERFVIGSGALHNAQLKGRAEKFLALVRAESQYACPDIRLYEWFQGVIGLPYGIWSYN